MDTERRRAEPAYKWIKPFMVESWEIEGLPEPSIDILEATIKFIALDSLTLNDVKELHWWYCGSQHRLRDEANPFLNVVIGSYRPPPSSPDIAELLSKLLKNTEPNQTNRNGDRFETSYTMYLKFEALHPFTDGNGRIGRAIWLWWVCRYQPEWARYIRSDGGLGFKGTLHYQSCDHFSHSVLNPYIQHGAGKR